MITFMNSGRLGRFGNQMFQYASLMGIAKKLGYDYGVNYSNKHHEEGLHFLLPDVFEKLSAKDCSNYFPQNYLREPTWEFNEYMFTIPDNTDILGYFQSEKYFEHCKDDVAKEFTFKQEIEEKIQSKRKLISDPVISLHIRLGDYKNYPTKFPIPDINYYKQGLEHLPKDVPIYIFSDEPNEAKNIFSSLNKNVSVIEGQKNWEDMCLMKMCEWHIIANSSFSWWGAWLGNSKKVVAPATWFGDAPEMPKNWSDIYCEGWEII